MNHPHLEGLIRKWREDVAHMYASGATVDTVIEHVAIARTTDADELEAALAALPGGGVEYQFEVWQDDGCQAYGSGDTLESIQSEAGHYALMYGQDGPVEVKYFERREIVTPTPNPHEADRNE